MNFRVYMDFNPFTPESDQLKFSVSVFHRDIFYSMENFTFDSLLRQESIIELSILTSLIHLLLEWLEKYVLYELRSLYTVRILT